MVIASALFRGRGYRIFHYSMMAVVAAAVIAAAIAIGMGAADRLDGDERLRGVRLVSDGSSVSGGSLLLTRYDDAVDFTFSTAGLPAQHIVSLKALIFNKPENCKGGSGRLRCGEDDLGDPAVEGSVVFVTSVFLRQYTTIDAFKGRLAVDDKSHAAAGDGLTNPQGADVHLVVVDRGPPVDGYGEVFSTLGAGCNNTPPDWGRPGPNTCVDIQVAAHEN